MDLQSRDAQSHDAPDMDATGTLRAEHLAEASMATPNTLAAAATHYPSMPAATDHAFGVFPLERSPARTSNAGSPPEARQSTVFTTLGPRDTPGIPTHFGGGDHRSVAGSSRAGPYANSVAAATELRTFVRSDAIRPGLESGDVVVLLSQGRPYHVVQASVPSLEDAVHYVLELSPEPVTFATASSTAASSRPGQEQEGPSGSRGAVASLSDLPQASARNGPGETMLPGTSYLEVVRQGPYLGLRSSAAGQRFLQPRRKPPHTLQLFSDRLGVWEQWEVSGEEWRAPWTSLNLKMKSRQLPKVELLVQVVRVGQFVGLGGYSQGFRTPRTTSVASEHMSWTPGLSALAVGGSEDEHLKRLSGLFMHEWLRFVENERQQRRGVERSMQLLVEDLAELKMDTIAQVEMLRCDMGAEMAALSDALKLCELQLAAAKVARRRAIEAAVAAGWRRAAMDVQREAFAAWRAYSLRQAALRCTMLRAVARLSSKWLGAALAAWVDHARHRAAVRAMNVRALYWSSRRRCALVLGAWAAWTKARQVKQQSALRADAWAKRRLAAKALAAWRAWIDSRALKHRAAAAAASRAQRSLLRRAFSVWRCAAAQATERKVVADDRARAAVAAAAIAAWHAAAVTQAQERCAAHRAKYWHRRRLLLGAWQALRTSTEGCSDGQRAAEALQRQHELQRCQRVLQAWQEVTAAHKAARATLHRLARRFDQGLLRQAWLAWHQQTDAAFSAAAKAQAWQERRERRLASSVLEAWATAARLKRVERAAEARWSTWYSKRLVRRVLLAWQGRAAAGAVLGRLGARLQGHRKRLLLRGCLEALKQEAQSAAARHAALSACVQRWQRGRLALALERWRALAELRTQGLCMRLGKLSPGAKGALALGLGSWWASTLRILVTKAAGAGPVITGAARSCQGGDALPAPSCAGSMPGLRSVTLSAGLNQTSSELSTGSEENQYGSTGLFMPSSGAGPLTSVRAPAGACGVLGASGIGRGVAEQGGLTLQSWAWLLRLCWQGWRQECGASRDLAAVADQLLLASQAKRRVAVLGAWRAQAELQTRQRRVVAQMLRRGDSRLLCRTFQAWATLSAEVSSCRRTAESRAADLAQRTLRDVLSAWAHVATKAVVLRRLGSRLLERRREKQMRCHLYAWRNLLVQKAEQKERLSMVIKSKKVAFAHFKQWYWETFDADVQDTIRQVFQTTESCVDAGETPWQPSRLFTNRPGDGAGSQAGGMPASAAAWASPPPPDAYGGGHAVDLGYGAPRSQWRGQYDTSHAQWRQQYHEVHSYPDMDAAADSHPWAMGAGVDPRVTPRGDVGPPGALPPAASFSAWAFGSRLGSAHSSMPAGRAPSSMHAPMHPPGGPHATSVVHVGSETPAAAGSMGSRKESGRAAGAEFERHSTPPPPPPPGLLPPAWRVSSPDDPPQSAWERIPVGQGAGQGWGQVSNNALFDDEEAGEEVAGLSGEGAGSAWELDRSLDLGF